MLAAIPLWHADAEYLEPLEAGGSGDEVFLGVRFVGHGAAAGIPLETELAHVYTIRYGRAASAHEYTGRNEGGLEP